jgi:hypothetical protein
MCALGSFIKRLSDGGPMLLHSTFDCGFRAIGATVDLVVPASFFVLVGNLGCLTRGSLGVTAL